MLKFDKEITEATRMHSSRMRTGRSLTVCCSLLPGGPGLGGCLVWGALVWGGAWSGGWGVCSGGGLLPGGASQHALRQTPLPPVDRQTPVKILPWPNFVAAGKNVNAIMNCSCEF